MPKVEEAVKKEKKPVNKKQDKYGKTGYEFEFSANKYRKKVPTNKPKVEENTEEIKQIKTSYPYNKRFIVNSPRAVARHRERLQLLLDEYDKEIEECYIKIRSQKN